MANKFYSIGAATAMADIKAALIDKYGSGLTIHYDASGYLIFSCPAISDKVIRIYSFFFFYGDAYSSGNTITNQYQFAGYNGGTGSEGQLVLGDNFLWFYTLNSTFGSEMVIIGKLTNNKFICIGLCGSNSSSYSQGYKGRNTTLGVDIALTTHDRKFTGTNGRLFTEDLIFMRSDGSAEENSDGTLASLLGVKAVSYNSSATTYIKGSNFVISATNMYMYDAATYLRNSLLLEF